MKTAIMHYSQEDIFTASLPTCSVLIFSHCRTYVVTLYWQVPSHRNCGLFQLYFKLYA